MRIFCNPLNLPYRYQMFQCENGVNISREAADPSLVWFKGNYCLFPSMTGGFFTSPDLLTWSFHPFLQEMPVYDYAPDVRAVGAYLYFCASRRHCACSFYRSKDPLHEKFEEIPESFPFWDPNLFADDDGRLYFYWGCSNLTPIYGVELDAENLRPIGTPIPLIRGRTDEFGYERTGDDHIPPKSPERIEADIKKMLERIANADSLAQLPPEQQESLRAAAGNDPYIEGPWMTKYNGRYYLQYAVPGTEYNIYADGVYVGDHPLGPFRPAENNPYSYHPGGFVTGAGHGSTIRDMDGRYWHAATMRISRNHIFERRLGLWKAGFDDDGELYCDQRYGDWPIDMDAPAWEAPKWMLLSYQKPVRVSSGQNGASAVDEDIRTWWSADRGDPEAWIEVDLCEEADVRGVQINFADEDLTLPLPEDAVFGGENEVRRVIDNTTHKTRWLLEGSLDGIAYRRIRDNREAETDLPHDFVVMEDGVRCRYLRLTVTELPYGQQARVSGLRVFGRMEKALPAQAKAEAYRVGDLDMEVRWEAADAVGVNILWGHSPDKLYHSYRVFGKNRQVIGALRKGQAAYVRVDSFHEGGITTGSLMEVPAAPCEA